MLRYLRQTELGAYPRLRETMFRDRAAQFRDRLDWAVEVDAAGFERDAYDALAPLYVIWETPSGRHGGSMRFLPTAGRTMVEEHFPHLTNGVPIRSPHIWECTRFCLAPDAGIRVSAALMLGGLEVGLAHGLSHAIGVFDARMVRIYRALGWPPAPLGSDGDIAAGLWAFDPALRASLARRARLSPEISAHWARRAFALPLPRAV